MKNIVIHEIGPRDGLQNIANVIPTAEKLKLIELLVNSGVKELESTAFVSPAWVPQMADAAEIAETMRCYPEIVHSVLVPNLKGLQRAVATGTVHRIVGFISASEIHNSANLNKSIRESLQDLAVLGEAAASLGLKTAVNIATAFGYLEREPISLEQVLMLCKEAASMKFTGITLCDTTGVAHPELVYKTCKRILEELPDITLAVHFHQKHGIEFANAYAAYLAGITHFEAAAGGLGGCPFAKGAEGNIATERIVEMFTAMGIDCGIDREKLQTAAEYAKELQVSYA